MVMVMVMVTVMGYGVDDYHGSVCLLLPLCNKLSNIKYQIYLDHVQYFAAGFGYIYVIQHPYHTVQ